MKNNISIDTPIGDDDEDGTLSDVIPSEDIDNEAVLSRTDGIKMLHRLMEERLTGTERLVIELRFGFNTGAPVGVDAIAKILDVSRTRVKEIETKALRHLNCEEAGVIRELLGS